MATRQIPAIAGVTINTIPPQLVQTFGTTSTILEMIVSPSEVFTRIIYNLITRQLPTLRKS